MAASKRLYQSLAGRIFEARRISSSNPWDGRKLVGIIADVLQEDNPRFDRARFLEACETGRCKGMRPVKRLTSEQDGSAYNDESGEALLPPCAAEMGCLCVGHARGLDAAQPCDTRE